VLEERFPKEHVWCTHAIVVWAKLHGYTPVSHPAEEGTEDVPSGPTAQRTYSEPVAIMEWLVTNHKSDQCSGAESDDEVDVLGIQSEQSKGELNDVRSFSKYELLQVECNLRLEQLLDCLSHLLPGECILLTRELVISLCT
jgi:hypothetical protein